MPSAEFEEAYSSVTTLKSKPGQDEQLSLYALSKIAKGEEVAKPGTFDFTGKAKHGAWQKKKDTGISAADAEKEYIKLVDELKTKYGTQ